MDLLYSPSDLCLVSLSVLLDFFFFIFFLNNIHWFLRSLYCWMCTFVFLYMFSLLFLFIYSAFSSPLDTIPASVAVRCRNETTLQKHRTAERLPFICNGLYYTYASHSKDHFYAIICCYVQFMVQHDLRWLFEVLFPNCLFPTLCVFR